MIVIAIKLKNGTQVLGELVEENANSVTIQDVIAMKESVFTGQTTSPYVQNIPYLYFPYADSMEMEIKREDILYHNVADDYTTFYYSNVFYDLVQYENKKRDFILEMYNVIKDNKDSPASGNSIQENFLATDEDDEFISDFESDKPTLH